MPVLDAVLHPAGAGARLARAAAGDVAPRPASRPRGAAGSAGPGDARGTRRAGRPHEQDSAYQSQGERSITSAASRSSGDSSLTIRDRLASTLFLLELGQAVLPVREIGDFHQVVQNRPPRSS